MAGALPPAHDCAPSTSQPSDKLARSQLLYDTLEEVSSKLTEFVRRICEKLGLDPDVTVLASFRRFYEEDFELLREEPLHEHAREVCGYYDPKRRLIVISVPSLMEGRVRGRALAERLARTLAHELVHHCQFTGGKLCEVHLDPELAERARAMLPYDARPHEVEAYGKQDELADVIQRAEEFEKIISSISRLSLNLNISYMNPFKFYNLAYSLTYGFKRIVGKETILSIIKDIIEDVDVFVKRYKEIAEEECLKREINSLINEISSKLEDIPTVRNIIQKHMQSFCVKDLVVQPVDSGLRVYLITDEGFALAYSSEGEVPFPMILKPKNPVRLGELQWDALRGVQISYYDFVSGNVKIEERNRWQKRELEFSIEALQLRSESEVFQEVCKRLREYRSSSHIDLTRFIALLCLAEWSPGASVSVQRFNGLGCWLAEVKDSKGVELTRLMAPSELELIDDLSGVKAKVVNMVEKINEPEYVRDLIIKFLKKFFIEYLSMLTLQFCYKKKSSPFY
ncbi:MAG: hypothetical protein LM590_09280 [Thermofilum sp.]|nr:hypothetical protein [Thermofilum sp.]